MTQTERKLIEIEIALGREVKKKYKVFFSLLDKEVKKKGLTVFASGESVKEFRKTVVKLMNKAGLNNFSDSLAPFMSNIESVALEELSKDFGQLLSIDDKSLRRAFKSKTNKINSKIFVDQKKFISKKLTIKGAKGITSESGVFQFVKSLTKGSQARVETLVRTSVQTYDNIVVTQKANELGLNKFKYAGTNDSKVRPFGRDKVGKIFTDEEAKKWDNGQISPASETLCGYNCRHRKRYINDSMSKP